MENNVVQMPHPFHISVSDCLEGITDEGAVQVVAFFKTADGTIHCTSNVSAVETEDLIDLGLEEFERLCEFTDEDEEDGER